MDFDRTLCEGVLPASCNSNLVVHKSKVIDALNCDTIFRCHIYFITCFSGGKGDGQSVGQKELGGINNEQYFFC